MGGKGGRERRMEGLIRVAPEAETFRKKAVRRDA